MTGGACFHSAYVAFAGGLGAAGHRKRMTRADTRDTPRSGPGSPGPGGETRPGRPVYGRETERAVLAAALDSCAGGRPRALYVEGAAGTGKSTVLAEAQADAHLRGWTVLTGRSSILEAANDFGVLRQLLDALPPLPDASPAAVLGQVPADSSPFAVFERVSAHLLDVAARGPVLITVDDLHWCDASSLRLLAYLANRNTDQPVALVLAGSPGELSGHRFMLDELVASCERQTLGRLNAVAAVPVGRRCPRRSTR